MLKRDKNVNNEIYQEIVLIIMNIKKIRKINCIVSCNTLT